MTKEQREMSEKCVQGLGYQGNNLLCSNWDADHMEKLDYNGMYELVEHLVRDHGYHNSLFWQDRLEIQMPASEKEHF